METTEVETLFLDEIGDLSKALQIELLGLIENKASTPSIRRP